MMGWHNMCFKCIYSVFIIILGLIVFFNEIYIEQYSMYFICFCLLMPIFISFLDKFEIIKIGSFVELSKKLDNIEKQQAILFRQISCISNNNSIIQKNYYSTKEPATNEEFNNKKNIEINDENMNNTKDKIEILDMPEQLKEKRIDNIEFIKTTNIVLHDFLRNRKNAIIEYSPQKIDYSIGNNIKGKVIFDAFYQEYNSEFFVEVKSSRGYNSTKGVSKLIETIKIYNELNNKSACLILVLFDYKPISEEKYEIIKNKYIEDFKNEIEQNILFIEYYDYNKVQNILIKQKEKEVK